MAAASFDALLADDDLRTLQDAWNHQQQLTLHSLIHEFRRSQIDAQLSCSAPQGEEEEEEEEEAPPASDWEPPMAWQPQ